MNDPSRARVEREYVIEREGPRVDRARRVTERLQAKRPESDRFETLVIRAKHTNAFTFPGRTIYITDRLLDDQPDDAAAAFVIAHEMAHHHLGHLDVLTRVSKWLDLPIPPHERERHADLHALELCIEAGYEAERCIVALQMLDAFFHAHGEPEATFGEPRGGYFSSSDRIAYVQAHVAAYRAGTRILDVLAAERRTVVRRKLKPVLAAAGSIAAGLALLLIRRR